MKAFAAVLSLALAGCASASRIDSYGPVRAGERVETSAGVFVMRRHPTDGSVWIVAPHNGASFKAALIGDLTLGTGTVQAQAALRPSVMNAASIYASGKGCSVADLYQLDTFNWEAKLVC